MAEVGRRLGSGLCRLSALGNGHNRAGCAGEGPGSARAAGRLRAAPPRNLDRREARPESEGRWTVHRLEPEGRRSAGRDCAPPQADGGLVRGPPLELDASCLVGFVGTRESLQAHRSALILFGPVPQEKLRPGRMSGWTRGAVSLRPPQQLRALCTVLFVVADQGSAGPGGGLRRLKLQPDPPTATRNYSYRRGPHSEEPPFLYKDRLSYYDTLKVSPTATQSQIKAAYYKQSFIYHPDKNPGDKDATQRFSEISNAYAVLGNIHLRRKYDRGILNQSDIQNAGRWSSKETTIRSTGSPQKQQRTRRYFQAGGKPMFDFDAFYKAHYGDQLQREREMRGRKEYMEQKRREHLNKWGKRRLLEVTVGMLLAMAGVIFLNLRSP